ncbi:MAG TPA: 6-phosphogluconolactonase [Vicinamibacterales bacterium]|jgi:6-phosphogluconolactonase
MNLEVLDSTEAAARRAAAVIAAGAQAAIDARGRYLIAVSGGRTPWLMLRELCAMEVPWAAVHLLQVDERVAPDGHPDRNLTHVQESLLDHVPIPITHVHAMPVNESDLAIGASEYQDTLRHVAGSPPVLDLVHLGLGPDGHTASLVPGDPVLKVTDADVAITGDYQGRRRMTLTYPALNRARQILWVVTGSDKTSMLTRLLAGDASIPAGNVRREGAVVVADTAAAGT